MCLRRLPSSFKSFVLLRIWYPTVKKVFAGCNICLDYLLPALVCVVMVNAVFVLIGNAFVRSNFQLVVSAMWDVKASISRIFTRVNSNETLRLSTMNDTCPNPHTFLGALNGTESSAFCLAIMAALRFENETGFNVWRVTDEIGKDIKNHPVFIALFSSFVLPYLITRIWSYWYDMPKCVARKFENPDAHALIREGPHFERTEECEVKRAFLNQTDTLGLVGVVFGPAGTGKSNVVRSISRSEEINWRGEPIAKGVKGVIYMEIGSPHQFPYYIAKACGVPIEPNWFSAAISKLFPAWKTHLNLPSNDKDALALVLPVIAEGCMSYKKQHSKQIPVLFIDGVDILAKQKDNTLYVNLVDWAKKCANEDSLRIVLVCSDSHVLALDQQSFKSRLDALIEIDDVDRDQAVKELMMDKYGLEKDLADKIYETVDGRLADIHKIVAVWRNSKEVVVPQEVVNAVNGIPKPYKSDELRKDIGEALNHIEHPINKTSLNT